MSKVKGWLGVGNKRLLLAQGVGSVLCVGWRYPARKWRYPARKCGRRAAPGYRAGAAVDIPVGLDR